MNLIKKIKEKNLKKAVKRLTSAQQQAIRFNAKNDKSYDKLIDTIQIINDLRKQDGRYIYDLKFKPMTNIKRNDKPNSKQSGTE